MSPDNRSPYFLFETLFASPGEFYSQAEEKIRADYGLLKEGLAKDGLHIRELGLATGTEQPEDCFVETILNICENAKAPFDYCMLIFLPAKIENGELWLATVDRLFDRLSSCALVRVAVADTADSMLKPVSDNWNGRTHGGRFVISGESVQEYLLKVASGGWSALSSAAPVTRTPREPPSASGVLLPDEAARLRTAMAKAAAASAAQNVEQALAALREARMVCSNNGLKAHEAITVMAMANTFLASGMRQDAITSYQQAIQLTGDAPVPVVVMQARLGKAAALFHGQNYREAAIAYEQAADDAIAAESDVMRLESLRMAATCHLMLGSFDAVTECWKRGLASEEAGEMNAWQTGEAFASACQRHGLVEQAKSVRQQVEGMRNELSTPDHEEASSRA